MQFTRRSSCRIVKGAATFQGRMKPVEALQQCQAKQPNLKRILGALGKSEGSQGPPVVDLEVEVLEQSGDETPPARRKLSQRKRYQRLPKV